MRTHLDFRHYSIFGFSMMFLEFRHLVAKDEEIAYWSQIETALLI